MAETFVVHGRVRKVFDDKKPYGFYLDSDDESIKDVRIGVWERKQLPVEGQEGEFVLEENDKGFINLAGLGKNAEVVYEKEEKPKIIRDIERARARERALGCAVAALNDDETKFPAHVRAHVVAELAEIFEAWLLREEEGE